MIKISIDNQFVNIDKICNKSVDELLFDDVIKLFFYTTVKMSEVDDYWKTYYTEFQNALNDQNEHSWPQLIFTRNYPKKRLDCLVTGVFISSDNLLLLLLQLYYIEKCKQFNLLNNLYISFEREEILCHNVKLANNIDELSVDILFELLKLHITYYLDIYNNKMLHEHKIGINILNQF